MPLGDFVHRVRSWAAVPPTASHMILVIALFQYTHWFKPSEPYLVDYAAEHGGISNEVVYDQVYPWYTYTLLPCTLLAGFIFEAFGPSTALICAAVADVFSVGLVIPATASNLAPFIASELAFSLSFTSLFLVTATLSTLLLPEQYQKACSYNRAATLISTMSSSLIGQALASNGYVEATVSVSLGFSLASIVGLLAAVYLGMLQGLHKTSKAEDDQAFFSWPSIMTKLHEAKACLATVGKDALSVVLGLAIAVFLSVHTLALTYWQSLFEIVAPGENANGGILAAAYAFSAIATLLPSLSRVDSVCMNNAVVLSIFVTLAISILLVFLSEARTLPSAAVLFVIYHALAEAGLVVLNAQLGRRVATLMDGFQNDSLTVSLLATDSGDERVADPALPLVQHELQRHGATMLHSHQENLLEEGNVQAVDANKSKQVSRKCKFGAIFTAVTFASQAIQIAIQYGIGPQGANLALQRRYALYGILTMGLLFVLLGFHLWNCYRQRYLRRN